MRELAHFSGSNRGKIWWSNTANANAYGLSTGEARADLETIYANSTHIPS